jgi:hypothetical protein
MTKKGWARLRTRPECQKHGNQQPEQPLHKKKEETPEAESFDPLTYAHTSIYYRAARAFITNGGASPGSKKKAREN